MFNMMKILHKEKEKNIVPEIHIENKTYLTASNWQKSFSDEVNCKHFYFSNPESATLTNTHITYKTRHKRSNK